MALKSINPYNQAELQSIGELNEEQIESKIRRASESFLDWKRLSYDKRASILLKTAQTLRTNKEKYAQTISLEMGKLISESRSEVEKCAWVCEYYAEHAADILATKTIKTYASKSFVQHQALGTILLVMPWNFPFWQVFRQAAPSLMAGNSLLLKHASNVQMCGQLLEDIFHESNLPEGLFQNLAIGSSKVAAVLAHEGVKAVSLTGSEAAGAKVAALAGEKIKKSVLELGGSNAFIVFEDANIEKAVKTAVKARMMNSGQSCIASKRFIVHRKNASEFAELFTKAINKMKMGDPLNEETTMAPLASIDQAKQIEQQVQASVKLGAKFLCGGNRHEAFYEPTLLTDVTASMPAFNEEVFGPVAPVIASGSDEESIKLANMSRFGLGATIFTNDIEKALHLGQEIEDGALFINELVKSDPRLPFGGTKYSGYGRELSEEGIKEFVNIKTVYVR